MIENPVTWRRLATRVVYDGLGPENKQALFNARCQSRGKYKAVNKG